MSELPKRDQGQVVQDVPKIDPEKVKPQTGYKVPTEQVELPSKGLLYPKENPLSSGVVEMQHMTAKHEDILTNQSYIARGIAIDELLKSLIVSKVRYDDLLEGDIESLMIAARVMGYGPEYHFTVQTPSGEDQIEQVDLTQFKDKVFDESQVTAGVNLFEYKLPVSGWDVSFKLLNKRDQDDLDSIAQSYKKTGRSLGTITAYLKKMIESINGNSNKNELSEMIENMTARDSRALRNFIQSVQPGVDTSMQVIDRKTGEPFRTELRFEPQFFWPDFER